jgi:hypothetical protein
MGRHVDRFLAQAELRSSLGGALAVLVASGRRTALVAVVAVAALAGPQAARVQPVWPPLHPRLR